MFLNFTDESKAIASKMHTTKIKANLDVLLKRSPGTNTLKSKSQTEFSQESSLLILFAGFHCPGAQLGVLHVLAL